MTTTLLATAGSVMVVMFAMHVWVIYHQRLYRMRRDQRQAELKIKWKIPHE